jgi:hypothetical protein
MVHSTVAMSVLLLSSTVAALDPIVVKVRALNTEYNTSNSFGTFFLMLLPILRARNSSMRTELSSS